MLKYKIPQIVTLTPNHASGERFGKEAPEAHSYGEDESGQRCDARGTFAPVLAVEAGHARALRMI